MSNKDRFYYWDKHFENDESPEPPKQKIEGFPHFNEILPVGELVVIREHLNKLGDPCEYDRGTIVQTNNGTYTVACKKCHKTGLQIVNVVK